MKNYIKSALPIFAVVAVLVILATALFRILFPNEAELPKIQPLENPTAVYNAAITKTGNSTDTYHVTVQKDTIIEDEQFREVRSQTITKLESDSTLSMLVDEQLSIGEHNAEISEIFSEDTVYMTVNGAKFCANANTDQYAARYAPVILIDPLLYRSVTGYVEKEQSFIEFTDAKNPEVWIWDESIHFESAEGYATISKDGFLLSSTYNITYKVGETQISMSITATPTRDTRTVEIPDDKEAYTRIDTPDAPRLLEKACGYLMDTTSISATYSDYIECTAFEDRQSRTIQIDAINNPSWISRTHTTVTYLDHSKAGSDSIVEKEELYIDGKYSIIIDNTAPAANDSVTEDAIRQACLNTFVGTIMLPQQIADAEITESETTYDIVYNGNSAFAEQLRANACETLYADPDILTEQTESYQVDIVLCYLRLDKATGLPVASGFRYEGTYTIDSLPYRLEFRADQQYEILNDNAQKTLNTLTDS